MAKAGRYTGAFKIGGGRKMFMTCSGSGTPTVILEAGAGGGANAWFAVQPWLATTTRVCSYDRANLPGGSSDPAPKPQTAASIVSDLPKLLTAAHAPGPYVFAGHPTGWLCARPYTTAPPRTRRGLPRRHAPRPADCAPVRAPRGAVEACAGGAVIIRHARGFLDRVATHVLAFEGDSQVRWFEGNFSEYEAFRHKELGAEADQPHRLKYKPLVRR